MFTSKVNFRNAGITGITARAISWLLLTRNFTFSRLQKIYRLGKEQEILVNTDTILHWQKKLMEFFMRWVECKKKESGSNHSENIHVYPFVAKILGLKTPLIDGDGKYITGDNLQSNCRG